MKITFAIIASIFASLVLPNNAEAAILNGSFENNFDNWETLGDYRIETTIFGSSTLEENFQSFLSTAYNEVVGVDANGQEIIGGNAAPATFITGVAENSLENFLDTSQFFGNDFLAAAIEGSAIKQTFIAKAGQSLSFSWNFLTNESVGENANSNFNDFAFANVSNGNQNSFFRLADTNTKFLATGSNTNFFEETGVNKFSYTLPSNGEYTISIGVVDVGEPTVISGLLVDNVQAIPETSSTISLLLLGTVVAVSVLKDKVRSRRYLAK